MRGDGELVARDERKRPDTSLADAAPGRPGEDATGGNVGNALRSVYDQMVNEDIPNEMLDLLGKLA
jgi:hypothetical protein